MLNCPLPHLDEKLIKLGHGGGGRMMGKLIHNLIHRYFDDPLLLAEHDGAYLDQTDAPLVMTTDSYVIKPLFFDGGNIGSLAINGTVNDLAMCGAAPLYLSVSFILEEGLEISILEKILSTMRRTADASGVRIVTGDTKVVERGSGDGIYINTTGIGTRLTDAPLCPTRVQAKDAIILSGDIGRHGMAVMSAREGLEFTIPVASDCAPLIKPVQALIDADLDIHCLRDATRGGVAAVLNEIAAAAKLGLEIHEHTIPTCLAVQGAAEVLGLDPLYVANEGRFVLFLPEEQADQALSILHEFDDCTEATLIGQCLDQQPGLVSLNTAIGGQRILDLPAGELLPRIC